MKAKLLGAAALGLLVAACGTDPQERTTGGAAAGAATGAGVGALGGPPGALAGAAIGGGAGAVTGAVTEPDDVNLGRPVWSDPETRVPGVTRSGGGSGSVGSGQSGQAQTSSSVRQAQQELSQRGYDVGPVDGIYGPRTARAAEEFQRANNLEVTGRLDSQTLAALDVQATGGTGQATGDRNRAYMGGGMIPDSGTSGTGGTMGTGATSPGTTGMGGGGSMQGRTGTSDVGAGGANRPTGTPPSGTAVPAPDTAPPGSAANHPLNDPAGGSSEANVPGRNVNR